MTKEHVWPQWLGRELGSGAWEMSRSGTVLAPAEWTNARLDVTVNCVCAGCNGGWMSRLEARAKPLLLPMIEDYRRTALSPDDQSFVGIWATKTAMMLGCLHPERMVWDSAQLAAFAETLTPPTGTVVRLALADGSISVFYRHNLITLTGATTGREILCFSSTSSMKHLVVQVFGHESGEGVVPHASAPDADYVTQVWPSTSFDVTWPPPNGFNAEGLRSLADAYVRE
jgi:hypothetical protein